MFFWFCLDYFVLVLFAFLVLDLVSSVLRQEIGKEEHLRNDLFCVKWNVKPELNQLMKLLPCRVHVHTNTFVFLVHGQVTVIFVVSVGLSGCMCRVFLSRL